MIDIVEKLDRETEKRIKQYPHPNNRASECGHPCIRFLVLSRLYPEKKALHEIGLQRIFDEGGLHERAVLREIESAGFELVEQQRAFEWRKFQLSGRIDAKIRLNGKLIPLEIKSCSPNIFPSIKDSTPEEMINSKHIWVRRYPGQILSYMAMDNIEKGIIIFKNKTTGEKCQKNFEFDYDYMEAILKKLEKVNEFVAKNEIPEVEVSEECNSCGFSKTVCFPDKDYGPGFIILSDAEKEEMLNRREELKDFFSEYNSLDKKLKAHFKGQNVICGDFKIESKELERKGYTVDPGSYIKVSIEKL